MYKKKEEKAITLYSEDTGRKSGEESALLKTYCLHYEGKEENELFEIVKCADLTIRVVSERIERIQQKTSPRKRPILGRQGQEHRALLAQKVLLHNLLNLLFVQVTHDSSFLK